MKRRAVAAIIAIFVLAAAGAQGLLDNSYYRKSLELRAMASTAFDEGDYDAAAGFAAQSGEYASLSDRYVDTMLAKSAADRALALARDKAAWAEGVGAKVNFAREWETGQTALVAAQGAYDAEDYAGAKELADAVLAALSGVIEIVALPPAPVPEPVPEPVPVPVVAVLPSWPASYVVRLIPERRDCLWRIAEYSFIYNDPLKWPVIYEANKKTFKDPNNPNLIFPGQVLQIPVVNGESRAGAWDPNKAYEAFPNPKK